MNITIINVVVGVGRYFNMSEMIEWDEELTIADKIAYWLKIEEIRKNLIKANVPEEFIKEGTDPKYG